MKSKKRHHSSEDDSEDSDATDRSSSSESESEESSASEHRHRKKKKRAAAESSESDSDSDDHRRSKKRKHKKKKKKHVKRKRRSNSVADSRSAAENDSSESEGEESSKKKRKKPKEKRSRSSSASVIEVVERKERRLHSVVKEPRRSSGEEERPARTYYQKEYRSESPQDFERQREREVQRFYRGSSKERRFQEQYQYEERERNERNPRFEGHNRPGQPGDGYQRRPREDAYHSREQPRGFNNRYNQYEERGPKRNFEDGRDNHMRDRRGPPEPERFREREFPERRERYRDEPFHPDRQRDGRREKPAPVPALVRVERPPPPQQHRNNDPRSHSVEERYRERARRDPREDRVPERRDERARENRGERVERGDGRGDKGDREESRGEKTDRGEIRGERGDRGENRGEREDRGENRVERGERGERERGERREPPRGERRPDRDRDRERERTEVKSEPAPREKKSRFADSEGDKEYSWGKTEVKKEGTKDGEKEKPNFGLSGKLTADANTVNGVVIKYTEPDDAKQPKRRWRFYPFKGDKALPILYIHRQSAFLIGRDKKVCDITLEHPSISKQHSALQYRATPFTRPDGSQGRRVRPYVIDLESANGTFVNNKKIEARRYVELLEKDVVKFGFSQREYVLLHENSKDDAQDDDNQETPAVTTTDKIKQEKRVKQEVAEDGE